jgi:hypothetical protein
MVSPREIERRLAAASDLNKSRQMPEILFGAMLLEKRRLLAGGSPDLLLRVTSLC